MHFFHGLQYRTGQERKRKTDVKVAGYNGIIISYNEKCYIQYTFLFVEKRVGEVIGVLIWRVGGILTY